MVTAIASTHRTSQDPKRTPLLHPVSGNGPPVRRPKSREVNSRYLSLSTTSSSSNSSASTNTTLSSVTSLSSTPSRRIQAPVVGGKTAVSTPKSQIRAVSAERRRTPAKAPSSAERMLVTSMRSLSASFHGESYSLPVSKAKPPPTAAVTPGGTRKGTPERRKAADCTPAARDRKERDRENSKPSNQQQHRWPGRLRRENSNFLTRSVDYAADRVQSVGSSPAPKDFRKSMNELNLEKDDAEIPGICELNRQLKSGDTVKGRPHGLVVPPKFWQDSSNRAVHTMLIPDSPSPNTSSNRKTGALITAKKFLSNSPVSSPQAFSTSRGSSPHRGAVRSASPSKGSITSTGAMSRVFTSPSRARRGFPASTNELSESNKCSTPPSMLQFAVDARKGKLGENRIAEAHDLRLLHNRLLQWRLVNAMEGHTLLLQKRTAKRSLYNAWAKNSQLQHSVGLKRTELQLLRHNMKLYCILKKQEPHLECWSLVERDHCNSLSAAINALKASTLRLPIVAGAKADMHKVQGAMSCAVDMMQAMASSVCSLLSKVEEMNLLASELSSTSARGHHLLNECRDYLSITFIPLQVMHCSLRTQALQLQQPKINVPEKEKR